MLIGCEFWVKNFFSEIFRGGIIYYCANSISIPQVVFFIGGVCFYLPFKIWVCHYLTIFIWLFMCVNTITHNMTIIILYKTPQTKLIDRINLLIYLYTIYINYFVLITTNTDNYIIILELFNRYELTKLWNNCKLLLTFNKIVLSLTNRKGWNNTRQHNQSY